MEWPQDTGPESAKLLCTRQLAGIAVLSRHGFSIKVVNTVLVPGCKEDHIRMLAEVMGQLGVDRMNIIGLLPVEGYAPWLHTPAWKALVARLRKAAGRFLPQMSHCARCRADAAGCWVAQTGLAQPRNGAKHPIRAPDVP